MSLAFHPKSATAIALTVLISGLASPAHAQVAISEVPLYLQVGVPPLNMLVVGKDHKNYYEAYNDASDLNADGAIDVGYKPDVIEYFGYFNSKVCYLWSSTNNRFEPAVAAGGSNGKKCSGSGHWSGDFLNYLTTGRLDALRKVLYGGMRNVDTATDTTLQGAFFPGEGHSWGKEYQSTARDGYDISEYSPLTQPEPSQYHLFAVTTVTDNSAPLFRVLKNSPYRIWNWVSIEGPVANLKCFTASNSRVDCLGASGTTQPLPAHPTNRASFDTMETTYAIAANLYGSNTRSTIDCSSACNPFGADDEYMAVFEGEINIRNGRGGTYQFRVDGDDAIDFILYNTDGTTLATAGCYGGRGFGACGGGETSASVTLAGNTTYRFKFRQEEAYGGDGYRLQWRKTAGGNEMDWRTINTNSGGSQNGNGDFVDTPTLSTYDLTPTTGAATERNDYRVRVQVCPSDVALRESNCKVYANGTSVKPTGLLHDYGETDRMYFGLLTGSQFNNLEGGVLRRNISSFSSEVNATTGQFLTTVDGIARTLDSFRMIGGGYANSVTDNSSSDANWNWNNGTGNCNAGSIGGNPLSNGQCRMWGNPIGEMMFETLRYYAGASGPHSVFSAGGATQGTTEETTLGLTTATWKDPYKTVANGGLGYKTCAKPVVTVISDINPSYDGDQIPGNVWNTPSFTNPSTLSTFSLQTEGQAIWNSEFGSGTRNVFIGQIGTDASDGAPTLKSASSLGNIRGLAPEEPTKGGSYAASAVASYGWTSSSRINSLSPEKMRTYAVALASPLPRINFPVNGKVIEFVPFAKTAGGTFGGGTQKPTNTIVDFYLEEYVNLPGQPSDSTINGGRPYAVFRINYEDVEQGNDHDMDAIVRYEVRANADDTVTVNLSSEYAAGSAIQHMGYVVNGTTKDGVYLEVRDYDTGVGSSPAYIFNVPPDKDAGYCNVSPMPSDCAGLPRNTSRTFTPAGNASTVTTLHDPLWYAAKYGGFNDLNANGKPDQSAEWDEDGNGVPDKYFLVTNALTLKAQLAKAFDEIEQDAKPSGGVAASGARKDGDFLAYVPEYNAEDWTGDVKAYPLLSNGQLGTLVWSAAAKLPTPANRKIYAMVPGASKLEPEVFKATSLGTDAEIEALLGFTAGEFATTFGASVSLTDAVNYLRGDRTKEKPSSGPATSANPFRYRSRVIGDILGSQPEVLSRGSAGYTRLPTGQGGGTSGAGSYGEFVLDTKLNRKSVIFVGANDGMLHAFDGSNDSTTGGKELFAIMPNSVLNKTGKLLSPSYSHTYFVDASPSIGDAYIDNAWKSILLAPAGIGGKSIVAVDVTDPATSFSDTNILWETALDDDIGNVTGRPKIVFASDENWYALVGNGLNSTNQDAVLLVLNVKTGAIVKRIKAADGDGTTPNGLGAITPVDVDNDLKVDIAYAADYQGNVWKFDLTNANPSSWALAFTGGKPLFKAGSLVSDGCDTNSDGVCTVADGCDLDSDGQCTINDGCDLNGDGQCSTFTGSTKLMTGGVDVARHHLSGFMVFAGTGRYLTDVDNDDTAANKALQTFYGLWDNGTPIDNTNQLVQQKITSEESVASAGLIRKVTQNAVDWASKRGWYLDLAVSNSGSLTLAGERFIGEPRVSQGRVIFTTFTPLGDECSPGGKNILYSLSAITGAAQLTLNGCDGCGGLNLNLSGDSSPPALSPPVVVDPGDPGTPPTGGDGGNNGGDGCDVNSDGVCDALDGCDKDGDGDCDIDDGCDKDGDGQCSDLNTPPPVAKECKANLQVLLKDGAKTFSQVSCGRLSWRQML